MIRWLADFGSIYFIRGWQTPVMHIYFLRDLLIWRGLSFIALHYYFPISTGYQYERTAAQYPSVTSSCECAILIDDELDCFTSCWSLLIILHNYPVFYLYDSYNLIIVSSFLIYTYYVILYIMPTGSLNLTHHLVLRYRYWPLPRGLHIPWGTLSRRVRVETGRPRGGPKGWRAFTQGLSDYRILG